MKDGSTENVEGRALKLKGHEEWKLAYRKVPGYYRKEVYSIWDVNSGLEVCRYWTLKEAKERATWMFDNMDPLKKVVKQEQMTLF